MKKATARLLKLSCLTVAAMMSVTHVQAQSLLKDDQAAQQQAIINSMTAASAANAAAAYTGNPALAAPVAQPGQAMNPLGVQYQQQTTPGLLPGQNQPQQAVTMRYDKKSLDGFYGAALPTRLFNNVPSDW